MPLLDRMRQEGAVVIIKLDGERGPQRGEEQGEHDEVFAVGDHGPQ